MGVAANAALAAVRARASVTAWDMDEMGFRMNSSSEGMAGRADDSPMAQSDC
jgi:hypothetical protein